MISFKEYFEILKIAFFKNPYTKSHPFEGLTAIQILQISIYNVLLVFAVLLPIHLYFANLGWVEMNILRVAILIVILNFLNFITSILLNSKTERMISLSIIGGILSSLVHGGIVAVMGINGLFFSIILGIIIAFFTYLDSPPADVKEFTLKLRILFFSTVLGSVVFLGMIGYGFIFLPIFQLPIYPFIYFQKVYNQRNPLQWNDNIALPLWLLSKKIQKNARVEREKCLKLCEKLSKIPHYKKVGQKAMSLIIIDELLNVEDLSDIRKNKIHSLLGIYSSYDLAKEQEMHSYKSYKQLDILEEFKSYLFKFKSIVSEVSYKWEPYEKEVFITYTEYENERRQQAPQRVVESLEKFRQELKLVDKGLTKDFIKVVEHWQGLIRPHVLELKFS